MRTVPTLLELETASVVLVGIDTTAGEVFLKVGRKLAKITG
ncbi:hypothetical protein [Promicromonospora sp. NPDC023987]